MKRLIAKDVAAYFVNKIMYDAVQHQMIFGEEATKRWIKQMMDAMIQDALENNALGLEQGVVVNGEKVEVLVFEKIPGDYDDFV